MDIISKKSGTEQCGSSTGGLDGESTAADCLLTSRPHTERVRVRSPTDGVGIGGSLVVGTLEITKKTYYV